MITSDIATSPPIDHAPGIVSIGGAPRSLSPPERRVAYHNRDPIGNSDDLELMLAGAREMVAGARRERRRLRALAARGATTPRQILPSLTRLERLAIHGARLARQIQWLDYDMQRHHPDR